MVLYTKSSSWDKNVSFRNRVYDTFHEFQSFWRFEAGVHAMGEKFKADIANTGICIDADNTDTAQSFSATVGLSSRGLPELVATGMPTPQAVELLTKAYTAINEGIARPDDSDSLSVALGVHVKLRELTAGEVKNYCVAAYLIRGKRDFGAMELTLVNTGS